jgi:site-specific DNA-cytosine methylase
MENTSEDFNVLSCFDGMSCGQIALNNVGKKYTNYFASEIEKSAIKVTQANYPNTTQLGDVTKVFAKDLPKIDLLIGGSPCQGFSLVGKQLNFDDPRSKLFFEFVRLKKDLKPRYFFLENVKMSKWAQDVISRFLECEPIRLNSNLVSAQNRERFYWTNIPLIIPKNNGITLSQVVDSKVEEKYFLNEKSVKYITDGIRLKKKFTTINPLQAQTILSGYNRLNGTFLAVNCSGYISQEKFSTITASYHKGVENYGTRPFLYDGVKFRKLTPIECERLQTVPHNYTNYVSDNDRYTMLGNGWTVKIIEQFFMNLNQQPVLRPTTLSLF